MRNPPLSVMATWPTPNYVDPPDRGNTLLIVELVIISIALLILLGRLYVRFFMVNRFGWDDGLMIAAFICCIGVTVDVILATTEYGWNFHIWDVHPIKLVQGRKASIAGQTIFVFASGLAKLSILLSYLRIAVPKSLFWHLTFATGALVAAAIVGFLGILWGQCTPPESYWDLERMALDCVPEGPPLMAQCIVTVITDFLVYVLPMPTLFQLKLPLVQRVSLMVLFGFGAIVVFAGCMRTYWVHYVEYETYDVTWEGFNMWIWAAVEVNLGVICGCVPCLRPLFFKSQHGSSNRSGGKTPSGVKTIGSSMPSHKGGAGSRRHASTAYDGNGDYIDLESLEGGDRPRKDGPATMNSNTVAVVVGGKTVWQQDFGETPQGNVGYAR